MAARDGAIVPSRAAGSGPLRSSPAQGRLSSCKPIESRQNDSRIVPAGGRPVRVTVVIALLAATLLAKDRVKLEPKWKAKERVAVKLSEVTASVSGGKEMVLATRKIEYVQTTIAVEKGLPTRAKRKFDVHELLPAFDDKPEKHELAGQEVEFVRQDGLLHSDKAPVLMTMGAGGDWTWMLPPRAVAVGDTWIVKKNIHMISIGTAFMGADTNCRLASVEGDKAVMEFTQPGQLKGSAEFSLKAGRVLKASFVWLLKSEDSTDKHTFTYSLTVLAEKKKKKETAK